MRFLIIVCLIPIIACSNQAEDKRSTNEATAFDTTTVIKEGQKITQAAFSTLSSNLQQAIAEGGVKNALQFCSIRAMPLTDSLSAHYNVELRRASHQPRNPKNQADSLEVATIQKYLVQIKKEESLEPVTIAHGDKINYHAPIRIPGQLCLNCHGRPGQDISKADLKTIQELYPNDQATGFEMGELRGIWSVQFSQSYVDSLAKTL
ncbi:Tll0287-like domain-containing protein [Fodinibius halophilus]|uniref:DUF3365 domain-containing protein n=1 Tax=Fodinibius halophilus TaxID=1736908 RepID=A0A6M1TNE5_9BACT|nr:DUF3365 domain-containing protein [Fodinibius halophilus]NGP89880.1 DUF3365 domain-containing protein [Fodinibius halophilus]